MPGPRVFRSLVASAGVLVTLASLSFPASAQTDLDRFMKDVVVRRDDNWRRLQQYILDERDEIAVNGPGGARLWGEQRDYSWFIRDGFFIRSPLRVDGGAVSESDRRKAEDEYLRRAQRRDARGRQADPAAAETPADVDGLIRQVRQPQFVSSSYFLRFTFDEGRYALAGREQFEGRDVLRIEYYPTRLYNEDNRRGRRGEPRRQTEKERREDAALRRVMNKVALITMWIEPSTHQIVKYTFDNVDFDFLPAAWIVKVDSVTASMTMSQPFTDVWLPKDIDVHGAFTLAIGQFEFRQTVAYHDYREANVASKVIIK